VPRKPRLEHMINALLGSTCSSFPNGMARPVGGEVARDGRH
jgi:hypothetical protein